MIEQEKIPTPDKVEMVTIPLKDYERFLTYEAKIDFLQQQLVKLQKLFTGSKSERFIPADDGQLSLEFGQQVSLTETPKEESTPALKGSGKKSHSRPALPAHLDREGIILDPSINLSGARMIGVVETEILELVEAKIIVKRYVRHKYLLPDGSIVLADLPSLPIPRGNAGPGFESSPKKRSDYVVPPKNRTVIKWKIFTFNRSI